MIFNYKEILKNTKIRTFNVFDLNNGIRHKLQNVYCLLQKNLKKEEVFACIMVIYK